MKLFVIASLIAVCTAGRLNHLDHSYLPPDNSIASKPNSARFGPAFDVGSIFAHLHPQNPERNTLSAATNVASQYYGPSAKGLGGSRIVPLANQQYSIPRTSYGIPHGPAFNNRQVPSRQYLTPSLNTKQSVKFVAPVRSYLPPSQNGHQQSRAASSGHQQNFGAVTSRQYLTPKAAASQNNAQQHRASNNFQQQQQGAKPSHQYISPLSAATAQRIGQQKSSLNFEQQQKFKGSANSQLLFAPNSGVQREAQQQFSGAKKQYHAPLAFPKSPNSQFKAMLASRQYLAPDTNNFDGIPVQNFNDRTGYHY